MKISFHSLILAITSTLVVIAITKLPGKALELSKPEEQTGPSVPQLAAYGIDIRQTSVSGVSSGGAMAVQMHVAHSSIMAGVGVIAGIAYDCAGSQFPLGARVVRGTILCLAGSFGAGADFSIDRTTVAAGITGAIDAPANLARQKVWLFSGYNDGSVRREAMNAVAAYYGHYVELGNIFYQIDNPAPHALITDDYGGACLGFNDEYINNCHYDAAGRLLEHIYGRLNPRNNAPSGSILEFDQSEFVGGVNPKSIGLADRGYVYVPTACTTSTCHVHVVFHGCKQYAGKIGRAVVEHGGYNKWADTNKLIVLYPQTVPTDLGNPNGCWDWWGFNDPLPNSDLARRTSYQISAIKAMLDRLTGGFVAGGSSDTFGTPQHFSTPDSTSTSVALIWQPNSAAAGFNIYQSLGMAGPYTKRNSIPVKGASFVDRGLLASTTYYFEIRAVDASNNESAPTSPISKTTGSRPPACDPYFSDNVTHVNNARAYIAESGNARALGTNQLMGLLSPDHFSHLIKPGPLPFFSVDYCP